MYSDPKMVAFQGQGAAPREVGSPVICVHQHLVYQALVLTPSSVATLCHMQSLALNPVVRRDIFQAKSDRNSSTHLKLSLLTVKFCKSNFN